MRNSLLLVLVLALALTPSLALADSLEGPPACPPGARGVTSHMGRRCHVWACDDATPCEAGTTCRPWRMCTQMTTVAPFFRNPNARESEEELVIASCAPDARCDGTEEPPAQTLGTLHPGPPSCTERRVCVPAALPPLRRDTPGPSSAPTPPSSGEPEATPSSPEPSPRGCGCRATRRGGERGLTWLLAIVVLAFGRRR